MYIICLCYLVLEAAVALSCVCEHSFYMRSYIRTPSMVEVVISFNLSVQSNVYTEVHVNLRLRAVYTLSPSLLDFVSIFLCLCIYTDVPSFVKYSLKQAQTYLNERPGINEADIDTQVGDTPGMNTNYIMSITIPLLSLLFSLVD